jgi:hypothetical protein|tara:strand:+ start:222 stop:515 length:294 start_codon:yes stop_codon:yes gene_type:complete
MERSQLGNYVRDALLAASGYLQLGDLEAVDKERQNLEANLKQLPDSPEVRAHLLASSESWGTWGNMRNLESYELFHDSNRPAGDVREFWICERLKNA